MANDFSLLAAQRRVFRSTLRPPERLVLLALLDHWSATHPHPHPSLNRLSEWTGYDRTTVMRCLNSLLEGGILKTVGDHRSGSKRSFDVRGVMRIAVAEDDRSHTSTGRREQPVAESDPTGCREQPEAVAESDPKEPREGTKEGTNTETQLRQVFEFWQKDTGHPRAKFSPERKSRIRARLKDGFSVEELCLAIKHRRHDPWLMGQAEKSTRPYDGLETLLRDTAQVERLRDLTQPARPRNGSLGPQQTGLAKTYRTGTVGGATPAQEGSSA